MSTTITELEKANPVIAKFLTQKCLDFAGFIEKHPQLLIDKLKVTSGITIFAPEVGRVDAFCRAYGDSKLVEHIANYHIVPDQKIAYRKIPSELSKREIFHGFDITQDPLSDMTGFETFIGGTKVFDGLEDINWIIFLTDKIIDLKQ